MFSSDILFRISEFLEPHSYYNFKLISSHNNNNLNDKQYIESKINSFDLEFCVSTQWEKLIQFKLNTGINSSKNIYDSIIYTIKFNLFNINKLIIYSHHIKTFLSLPMCKSLLKLSSYRPDILLQIYSYFKTLGYTISMLIDNKLIHNICKKNNIEIIKYFCNELIQHNSPDIYSPILNHAMRSSCSHCSSDVLQYLIDISPSIPNDILNVCCRFKSYSNFVFFSQYIIDNNLQENYVNDDLLYDMCDNNCSMEFFDYLFEYFGNIINENDRKYTLENFPSVDNIELIDYLLDQDFIISENTINHQCYLGNIKNVERLIQLKCPINSNTLPQAIKSKQLLIIKLLINMNNTIINDSKFSAMHIAENLNLTRIIDYLHYSIKMNILEYEEIRGKKL